MHRSIDKGYALLLVLLAVCMALAGCGSSGYAGVGLTGLSNSAIVIDAGQSYPVTAALSGNEALVSWSLSGASCSSTACGTLSAQTGTAVTYTAPAGLTSQMKVTLTAAVSGTSSLSKASITVNPDPAISGTPPPGTVGMAYSMKLVATGGTTPLTWSMAGALPAGLTFDPSTAVISGTPTAAGTSNVIAQIVDSSDVPYTVKAPESIVISNPTVITSPLTIAGNPPAGKVGVVYSSALTAAGGVTPYSWSVISGALPAGLTLSPSTGVISGTPTAQGTSTFTAQVEDADGTKASAVFSISISAGTTPLTLTLATLPGATVGVPYTATIGVAGGTSPYSCVQTGGTLPAGLSLSAACVVSGTPTTAGPFIFTVKATDSSSPAETVSGPESILVSAAASLVLSSPPSGTVGVPYTGSIGVSGGSSPYNCVLVSGTLPAGLTLGTGCAITGTPTATGTVTVDITATDSSNPVKTITGPVSMTINSGTLTLTLATLPGATVGVPYTATIGVSGGTAPYSCLQVGGTLPAGLTLSAACVVSGTPTVAGTSSFNVKATDSSSPAETVTGPESITVSPAALVLTLSNLPNATVGTPYTATIGVSGGTAPYNCVILSGTLPAGLTNTGCVISGTPTVAGTVSLSVKATDSSSPQEMVTGPVGLTVLPAGATLTITSPPGGTVNVPYSGTIGVAGGTAPYSCVITSGTLPAGLTLTGCTITGTPTTAGSTTVTVKATDTSNPTATQTGPVTLVISPATTTLTLSSPPVATIGVPYSGLIGVAGGTGPYSCSIVSGTLPAGLTLGANCLITGTPTAVGTATVQVHATDSATPSDSTTGPVTITVQAVPLLTLTGSVPNATLGVPYTQTLLASGGITPYTYAITAGALPAGLSLSPGGVISGTPTAVGASSFTVTVTDTETTPQTASLPLVLLVVYPTTPTDAELVGPYAFLFQGYDDVVAGVLAYQTATVGSFTADGTGVISAGELDSNHQASTATGNTISSNQFLGTYTLATNGTGYITITALNADGTTAATSTYAVTVKAPIAPATVATQASLIEFDNNALTGTRGSGTMLAQTAASFTAGLDGSYAFGMSGDTPCLPACTIGISAGPVASVGQFKTDGAGHITSGTSDANIATTNYADAPLTGSYDAADGNGRLGLTMDTAGTPAGSYPVDYAVYLVNANQAFILSTDKHSAYVLLAGSAQLQTQATFNNASLNGPFIGYENAQSNPGLLGTTLGDTLNLSTATIFRATGNSTGTCAITNVDVGGVNSLVTGLTGLGSGVPVLNALLGTYQSTGNSSCTVAANGRGVLNYPAPSNILTPILILLGLSTAPPPPREIYLISPNSGYFLETGYAGLGRFEAQSGAPFSLATLDGTYVYASQPAASLASINSSGILVANGAGSATTTLDLNVGVGTINVLETDQTSTSTYAVTDTTAGRYTFGTDVIYAISPTRFVLVDTNVLTTSPSVSLLY